MKKIFAVLHYIRAPREWEDGSVDKVFVGKCEKLSLDSQNLCKTGTGNRRISRNLEAS